jgi:hypothetical protein
MRFNGHFRAFGTDPWNGGLFPKERDNTPPGKEHERLLPGEGALPLRELVGSDSLWRDSPPRFLAQLFENANRPVDKDLHFRVSTLTLTIN